MNSTRQLNYSSRMEMYRELYLYVLRHRSIWEVILESGLLLLIDLVTVVGNILLCVVVYKNKSLRTLTNIFIVVLAFSDIVMGVLCIPFSVAVFIQGEWIFGVHICRMQCFLVYLLALGSLQTLTIIAVNRYYRVLKPAKYKNKFTFKSTIGILIVVWVTTAFFLTVTFLSKAVLMKFSPGKGACVMFRNKESSKAAILSINMTIVTVSTVIPTVVISFSYFRVFSVVGKHFVRIHPILRGDTTSQLTSNILEIKSTRTMFFVLLAFAICWLPVFAIEVLQMFLNWWELPRSCHLLWTFCGSLSTAVNPFVFGTTCRTFRKRVWALLFSQAANNSIIEASNTAARGSTLIISEFSLAGDVMDKKA